MSRPEDTPPMDRSWEVFAACQGVDPNLFYPDQSVRATVKEAKDVCLGCVVREECLEYALANDEKYGIWGGMTERERRRIKKLRLEIQGEEL